MKTTHTHHIIPRHIGGTDDPSNLIELTVEEHANAHKELYEQYGRWQDKVAWQTLSGQIDQYEASQQVRRNANLGNKHFEGKTHTEDYKKKLSVMMSNRRKEFDTMGNHQPHNEETKRKISDKLKGHEKTNFGGYTLSEEFKEKQRQRCLDDNPSKRPEVRAKLKEKALNRPKFPCPHCNKLVTKANLVRWHGDKCKDYK